MPEYKNCSNFATDALEAELIVEQGTIERLRCDSIRNSGVFWATVYHFSTEK